ncbi:unnamed protein product [Polarella glacialis]|uniref:Uncharacterized protein n=1 Tax=Polarella glacialis TaxID=89957 RepID=A0A813GFF1_POLGL|nr:unnamed protein product [Polarella glacialis]
MAASDGEEFPIASDPSEEISCDRDEKDQALVGELGLPSKRSVRQVSLLPPEVQLLFDNAKSLERGRRGRCLANMIERKPREALAMYAEALEALSVYIELGSPHSADLARIRKHYEERVALLSASLAPVAAAPFDEACRQQSVFCFDTLEYGSLAWTTKRVLQVEGELSHLHSSVPLEGDAPLCPALLTAFARDRKVPATWRLLASRRKQHIKSFRATAEYAAWLDAYRRFVREVVAPLVGDPEGLVFQCPPTLRCQLPSSRPLGRRHRDDAYEGHQGEEINFWLPLTKVWGSNTLHVESRPGQADFRPLELSYGEFLRFHGGQCEHFTMANDTGATRVSLDFRVIPRSVWRDQFGGRIGEYPCETWAPLAEKLDV